MTFGDSEDADENGKDAENNKQTDKNRKPMKRKTGDAAHRQEKGSSHQEKEILIQKMRAK